MRGYAWAFASKRTAPQARDIHVDRCAAWRKHLDDGSRRAVVLVVPRSEVAHLERAGVHRAKDCLTTKCFMILRTPTENENARERFLTFVRNDNACHLERSERSFSNPIFEGVIHDLTFAYGAMQIFIMPASGFARMPPETSM